ncbi:hypothetical protein [Acetobacter sp.]|uniref:hypothetical protein n=1 Tax=Acetobacter sp. TaxID=440 RepID=UPI0039E8D9DE
MSARQRNMQKYADYSACLQIIDDATHAAVCDLYALATVLDGFLGASEPPPLEQLRDWVKRIANNLDEANIVLPTKGATA